MAGLYGYSTASQAADQAFTSTLNTLDTLGQRRTNQAMQADIAGLKMPSFGADEGGDGRMGAINNALNYQQQMFEIGRKYGNPGIMSAASKNILTLQKDLTDYQRGLVTNKQADYEFSRRQLENTRKDMEYEFGQKFRQEAAKLQPVDPLQYGSDEVGRLRAELENAQKMLEIARRNQQGDFIAKYASVYNTLLQAYQTALQNRAATSAPVPGIERQAFANGGLVQPVPTFITGSVPYAEPTTPQQSDIEFLQQATEFGRGLSQLANRQGATPAIGGVSGQAGLFEIAPTGEMRQASPDMPGIGGLAASGSPLITQTSPEYSPLRNWFTGMLAGSDLNQAVYQARSKIVRENPATTLAGQAVQGVTTSTAEVERGQPAAAMASEALQWWDSEANRYFRENPAALDAAVTDPVGFYRDTIRSGGTKPITSQLPADGATAMAVRGVQRAGKSSLGENLPPPPNGVETYTGPRMATAGNEAAQLGISEAQYGALNEAAKGIDAQALFDQGFVPGDDAQQNEAAIAQLVLKPAGLKTYSASRDQLVAKYSQPAGVVTPENLVTATSSLGELDKDIRNARNAANAKLNTLYDQYDRSQQLATAAQRTGNATLYTTEMGKLDTIRTQIDALIAETTAADTKNVNLMYRQALDVGMMRAQSNPTDVAVLNSIVQARPAAGIQSIQPMYGGSYLVTNSDGNKQVATLADVSMRIQNTFPEMVAAGKAAVIEAQKQQFESRLKINEKLAEVDAQTRKSLIEEEAKAAFGSNVKLEGDLTTGITVLDPYRRRLVTITEVVDANGIKTYPVSTIPYGQ